MSLAIGQTTEIQGSGSKPYTIKNVDGTIWSCTCPAWRNSGGKVDLKTCKHVKKVLGSTADAARLALNSGVAVVVSAQAMTQQAGVFVKAAQSFQNAVDELSNVNPSDEELASGLAQINQAFGGYPPNPHPEKIFTCTPDRARDLLENAKGRKLRPDEHAKLYGPPILLANKLDDAMGSDDFDPKDYWLSEKLDGVRGYWDPSRKQFVTREGNRFNAPAWFTAGLPDFPLDGELWMGRQKFQETLSVVRKQNPIDAEWQKIKFVLFDAPAVDDVFEERIKFLENQKFPAHVVVLEQIPADSFDHIKQIGDELVALGAEGIMLRRRGSKYTPGRNSTLLKSKPFKDDEGEIVGHTPGKNRHKGRLGGLKLRLKTGVEFDLGTGLKDHERNNPPAVGKWVTFRYTELTKEGKPKCASFVTVRDYE